MKKTNLLMATALCVPLAFSPFAATAAVADDTAHVQLTDYDEDARDIFAALSEAHLNLQKGKRQEAEEEINEAFEELEEAFEDSPTVKPVAASVPLTKIVELKFGNALMPHVVYIPVGDEALEVDDFEDDLDLTGIERGDVEDARVKYVRLTISRDALVHDLNEAREELTSNDIDGAQAQLHDAQSGMIEEFEGATSEQMVARDHVALTRYMLRAAEYEGAREALEVAETAMVGLQAEKDGAGRNAPEIERIRAEMEELQDLISRRDPSLADQIDRKLEAWWDDLG